MNFILIAILAVFAVGAGVLYYKSKAPLKTAVIGVGSGVISLGLVKILLALFGVILSFNLYALAVSAIFGIPGTLLMVAFRFLWG